jgi:ribonuclease VapC
MISAVLDASAVLSILRQEPGGDKASAHIGSAAISAVNLHEVIKELMKSDIEEPVVRAMLDELRLDVHPHDTKAAYAAAALYVQTRQYGRGLGDRSCLSLALTLGVPALTTDQEWRRVEIEGLKIEHLR